MTNAQPTDRMILRALLRAADVVDENLVWLEMGFSKQRLVDELLALAPESNETVQQGIEHFAQDFSSRFLLRVTRDDDIPLDIGGFDAEFPRWILGEALGPLGSDLFPTQHRARRTATEGARELLYFGAGDFANLCVSSPLQQIRSLLNGQSPSQGSGAMLRELRPGLERSWDTSVLLRQDPYFHRRLNSDEDLSRLQARLREDPFDGTTVERLRDFFHRRATVGLRDTGRWLLGSRHPWFGWQEARELMGACFDKWAQESFFSPRVHFYAADPEVGEEAIRNALEFNREVVERFAQHLTAELGELADLFERETLVLLSEAVLDAHHDHPDFDIEAIGGQGTTTARFVGHTLYALATSVMGKQLEARQNFNMPAHLEAMGLVEKYLGKLNPTQQHALFQALGRQLRNYARGTVRDGFGRSIQYKRIPSKLFVLLESPGPHPHADEEVVDSFTLAQVSSPQYTHRLQEHPEILEKLVVFFTLVLRLYLDTQHVPDLRPEEVKDFILLGLWGTNTPNVTINIYKKKDSETHRSEIRFSGRSQVKSYQLYKDRKHEAALARLALSQLGPLLEPSILRSLGTFLMAVAEQEQGNREQKVDSLNLAQQSLEVFRETARSAVKGSLVDVATAFEMLLDNAVDFAQHGIEKAHKLKKKTTRD